jgi:hypothetical protein
MHRTVLFAMICASLPLASSNAQSFDGDWSVLQVCETTQEGARGFTWRYAATVKNGHFLGQYRKVGESPSMTLEGQIKPDGTASLAARGISGSADFNQKFATTASPIAFQVTAKFSGTTGSGERVGSRACKFSFTKGR